LEPDLELLAPVNLTAVCFRHHALDRDANQVLLERMRVRDNADATSRDSEAP